MTEKSTPTRLRSVNSGILGRWIKFMLVRSPVLSINVMKPSILVWYCPKIAGFCSWVKKKWIQKEIRFFLLMYGPLEARMGLVKVQIGPWKAQMGLNCLKWKLGRLQWGFGRLRWSLGRFKGAFGAWIGLKYFAKHYRYALKPSVYWNWNLIPPSTCKTQKHSSMKSLHRFKEIDVFLPNLT